MKLFILKNVLTYQQPNQSFRQDMTSLGCHEVLGGWAASCLPHPPALLTQATTPQFKLHVRHIHC